MSDDEHSLGSCRPCSSGSALALDVVQEVDIYLSKKLKDNLHLLQYPLTSDDFSKDATSVQAKLKPKQLKLELTMGLDTRSNVYDRVKGEQIALNCSGVGRQNMFSTGRMDRMVYESLNKAGLHMNSYAVAYLREGKLYLNPVQNVIQLRPSFRHLNTDDAITKSKDGRGDDPSMSDGEEGASGSTIRVKFSREETDEMKKRREASYQHQKKMQSEEPWNWLEYNDAESDESCLTRELLACPAATSSFKDIRFRTDSESLLRSLAPKPDDLEISMPSLPSNMISLTHLRTLPLSDQIRALMMNVKVIRFHQLTSLLPPNVDETTVLNMLQQYAMLVRGCWVVKSEVLYPKDSFSAKTALSSEVICKARDYTLFLFTQKAMVPRKDIAEFIKIPNEDLHDILNQIAKFKMHRGWEFMYRPDVDFIEAHPDVVHHQSAIWESVRNQLNVPIGSPHRNRQRSGSGHMKSPPPRIRCRSGSKSQSSDSEAGDTGAPGGQVRGRRRSASHRGFSPPFSPPAVVRRVSTPNNLKSPGLLPVGQTNGSIVSTPSSPTAHGTLETQLEPLTEKDRLRIEFRRFLVKKFTAKPVLTLSEVKRLLLLELTESPHDHVLNNGVSDTLIEEETKYLGAVKFDDRKTAEPTYAITSIGDWPQIRELVVRLLQEQQRFKYSTFKSVVLEQASSFPSDAELRRLIKEYCTQKGNSYALLGT